MKREIAAFMQMYPRYSFSETLNEYAAVFFSMLVEGYRVKNSHYLTMASIVSIPHMKDDARQDLMRQLDWSTKSPSDILQLDDTDDSDGVDSVKNLLRSI